VPTVLRVKGYRIGFYSSEPEEPVQVHVHKDGHEAKFWLGPVQLSWNKGFREAASGRSPGCSQRTRPN
jgi:hypothetical protein